MAKKRSYALRDLPRLLKGETTLLIYKPQAGCYLVRQSGPYLEIHRIEAVARDGEEAIPQHVTFIRLNEHYERCQIQHAFPDFTTAQAAVKQQKDYVYENWMFPITLEGVAA